MKYTNKITGEIFDLEPYQPKRRGYRTKRRSWLERQLSTETGRLALGVTVALLFGLSL